MSGKGVTSKRDWIIQGAGRSLYRRAINNLKALPKIPARDSLKVLVKKLQERQY